MRFVLSENFSGFFEIVQEFSSNLSMMLLFYDFKFFETQYEIFIRSTTLSKHVLLPYVHMARRACKSASFEIFAKFVLQKRFPYVIIFAHFKRCLKAFDALFFEGFNWISALILHSTRWTSKNGLKGNQSFFLH